MTKKTYQSPRLTKLGSAAEMTQSHFKKKKWFWLVPPPPTLGGDKLS